MSIYLIQRDIVYGLHYGLEWSVLPLPRGSWRMYVQEHGYFKTFKTTEAAHRYAQTHKGEILRLIESAYAKRTGETDGEIEISKS